MKTSYSPGEKVSIVCDEPYMNETVTLESSYKRKTPGKPGHYYMQTWWRATNGMRFTEDCIEERVNG